MSKYMTRKDIAREFEVSIEQVKRNEAAWGLLPYRQRLSHNCLRYSRAGVLKAFRQRGWLEEETKTASPLQAGGK